MSIKFSLATNFSPELVEQISAWPVAELFGKLTADPVGGGRASAMVPSVGKERLRAHVARARSKGVGFNYLLNAACMDNAESTREGQRRLERMLEFVEDCGIGSVTVSLPMLLQIIKRRFPRLRVRVGVFARVDNPVKARFWEDLGADTITLESISVNRDFRALEAIRAAVRLELQLIANSNCLIHCPLSGQHMVNLSHASQSGHKSGGFMLDYCALRCSYEKLRDPANYLRSEFIRPEDLRIYVDMGFKSFKILERGAPTAVLAERVRAYSTGGYDGNLLDLIQPYGYKAREEEKRGAHFLRYYFRPGKVSIGGLMKLRALAAARGLTEPMDGEPVRIENRALEGFIHGIRERDCRLARCERCGWCASYAAKAVRIDAQYRERLMSLYESCFDDMLSGRLWGRG